MSPKTTKPTRQYRLHTLNKDHAAYMALVDSIVANKRLAAEVVYKWLDENGFVLKEKAVADRDTEAFLKKHPELRTMRL